MINKAKQPQDVLGNKIQCPRFQQCPLCYGCRNYDTSNLDCAKCTENKKRDICNREVHTDELIAKFIQRNKIKVDGNISFDK